MTRRNGDGGLGRDGGRRGGSLLVKVEGGELLSPFQLGIASVLRRLEWRRGRDLGLAGFEIRAGLLLLNSMAMESRRRRRRCIVYQQLN